MYIISDELYHHGIKGQKWGVRRKLPDTMVNRSMTPDKRDSSVTKKVKNDYNNMTDQQFKGRYQVSKKVYAKRVQKYGDPYMYSPLAKMGKRLAKSRRSQKMYSKRVNKMAKGKTNTKNSQVLVDELGAVNAKITYNTNTGKYEVRT